MILLIYLIYEALYSYQLKHISLILFLFLFLILYPKSKQPLKLTILVFICGLFSEKYSVFLNFHDSTNILNFSSCLDISTQEKLPLLELNIMAFSNNFNLLLFIILINSTSNKGTGKKPKVF